jgi:glutamate--cysteine ligase
MPRTANDNPSTTRPKAITGETILENEIGCVTNDAQDSDNPLIESRDQLVEYLEAGNKSTDQFRLGAEQEQFVYSGSDLRPAEYDGSLPGIRALLKSLGQFGWEAILENGLPIALKRGGSMVTLEPGGQIELSGAPHANVHEIQAETIEWHRELSAIAPELDLSFLAIAHQPKHDRAEIPWMPKQRYRIMREWMPRQGTMGLDMMQATCSQQITLDFANEADMVKKFRVSLALQPVAIALFSNSPFAKGTVANCLSLRSQIWSHTDPQRSGSLPFVFEQGMGFERYVDYVLDVPMYFVERDGHLIDASGLSFRDFLTGQLDVLPSEKPRLADWESHLTTVFPQVRLKRFLEMRGADAGDAQTRVAALAALWSGILYDADSLDAAWQRVKDWSADEQASMLQRVACQGFKTTFRDATLRELANWMVGLSRDGLKRRAIRNANNDDESVYLHPLQNAIDSGQTFSERLIERFEKEWNQDMNVALVSMCKETLG